MNNYQKNNIINLLKRNKFKVAHIKIIQNNLLISKSSKKKY